MSDQPALVAIWSSIPFGRILQATISAVLDGLTKAVNHFFIYGDYGRAHVGQFSQMKPLYEKESGGGCGGDLDDKRRVHFTTKNDPVNQIYLSPLSRAYRPYIQAPLDRMYPPAWLLVVFALTFAVIARIYVIIVSPKGHVPRRRNPKRTRHLAVFLGSGEFNIIYSRRSNCIVVFQADIAARPSRSCLLLTSHVTLPGRTLSVRVTHLARRRLSH